jgi:integrase
VTESSKTKPVFRKVGKTQNLYRHAKSGTYYSLIKRSGKQFRRSLKTTDLQLAKNRLADLHREVSRLKNTEDAKLPFESIAMRWLQTKKNVNKPSSIVRRKSCIKNLASFLGGRAINKIQPHHCEEWDAWRSPGVSAQTRNHELSTLKSVFNYAIDHGLILNNPARTLKRSRIREREKLIPTKSQFHEIVRAIRLSDGRKDSQAKAKCGADLVELLAYSGCRKKEACSILWKDVDFGKSQLLITGGDLGTKNLRHRRVPMIPQLRELLLRIRPDQDETSHRVITIDSAKKALDTACRRLGCPKYTHHSFRHLFATQAIESGVDIPTAARWLGHSDGGALLMRTYGHLRDEHSFEMANKVEF